MVGLRISVAKRYQRVRLPRPRVDRDRILRGMVKMRVAAAILATLLVGACGSLEQSPTDLVRGASAKMQSAKSVHVEGTGSFGIKAGLSLSFDFKLVGDVEMPDKSRMSLQSSALGQNLSVEMLTVGGKAYAKDPLTGVWTEASQGKSSSAIPPSLLGDPMGNLDLSKVSNVVEIDRPVIDGKTTRHIRYTADPAKLADAMKQAAGSSKTPATTPTAVGEIWIRVDDGQIVRQSVKVTLEMDGTSSLFGALPRQSAAPSATNASVEMAFDFMFSKYGEPIPAITAPPTR